MDQQHNQKSIIPEFTTNGFNGIPHGGTNSLMSTLQSLQIQSMGNSMMPSSDLQCDLPNQFFLEQIQLRAMQSVYNSFGQKLDNQMPSQSFQNPQGGLSLPFNAITTNDVSTSNNAFASISSMPHNIDKYGNGSKPETSKLQTDFSSKQIGTNFPMDILSNSSSLGDQLGDSSNVKTTQMEDWMRNICVDNLLDPTRDAPSTSTAQMASTIQHSNTGLSRQECSSQIPDQIRPISHQIPSSSMESSHGPTQADAYFDEAHDDVDNIFGLSLAENDEQGNSMFRRPGSADRGLSPINFTPPDSPHEELTLDMLFGLPPENSKNESNNKSHQDIFSNDIPTTSSDLFSTHTDLRMTSSSPIRSAVDVPQTFSKPNKIPVYKQKAALMSLEARTAAKKENPNYDAFEFEDDEEMAGPVTTEFKREIDIIPKHETKVKNVYVSGVGFEVGADQEGGAATFKRPIVKSNVHESQQDKSFFTLADSLRERKDLSLSCDFLKPSQSNDTECSKNRRYAGPDQPKLPKMFIRVQQIQINTEDNIGTRKRGKKKKLSNDDDSDWDDVAVRRRKINRKLYSLHSEEEIMARRPPVDNLHAMGPNCCEFVRKRLSSFGPAEGILPKGTYVVCKADVLRDDCAIWRVDNQNLLQKFPPFREVHTNKQVYRSSSTYSGWCEQISSQYLRVAVRVLKQNRSETTIEPEIPLLDLFPAMSAEMFKTPKAVYIKEQKETPVDIDDSTILNDIRRVSLTTVVNALLNQVFTSNYVQLLLEKNDWSYVRSLSEIESVNKEAELRIRKRIPVEEKHDKYIEEYTRVAVSRSSFYCLTKCQICKRKRPRRVVHFFDKKTYNNNTLCIIETTSTEQDENTEEEPQPVVDAISCGRCATAVTTLHRMRHFQLYFLRICEEKLEDIGTSEIDLPAEKNVELAKADKSWIQSVIDKYCDMWNEARILFRDD